MFRTIYLVQPLKPRLTWNLALCILFGVTKCPISSFAQSDAGAIQRTVTNRGSGGPATLPNPDAVQEVEIETSDSSAKLSEPRTGIITTESKTNHLHGGVSRVRRITRLAQQSPDRILPISKGRIMPAMNSMARSAGRR